MSASGVENIGIGIGIGLDATGFMIAQPLTKEAFAPFGEVLETRDAETRRINGGTCLRFHALGRVDTTGEGAQVVVSVFRAAPTALPLHVRHMERHPLGSQAFWPLAGIDWLVVVAPDNDGQPGAPCVFRASGEQGVCYAPNVWHHSLIALDRECDFLVVDRDGAGTNLQEASYPAPVAVRG